MTEREHLAKLVYEAMRFALWAAGEGIGAQRGEPTEDPEDFLYDYSLAMGIDDWEGLPAVARDAILNAVGEALNPGASSQPADSAGAQTGRGK